MARSRPAPSRSSAPSHAAPARHAAPPAAPAKPAAAHQQAPPQQPQVTNVFVQRPGMGAPGMGMMGTIASVAVGSVVGHGISNMLFSKDQPPANPVEAQQVAKQYGEGACGNQIQSYAKCMEFNANNSEQCKWAWDMFMQCQDSQPKTGGSA